MGEVTNLWDVAVFGERGEPTERAALLRLASAGSATETEIENVLIGQTKLQGEMGEAAEVKRTLAEKTVAEAAGLVAKMKENATWTLGQFGTRSTRKTAELLSASSIESAIGAAALEESAAELTRLENKLERIRVAKAAVIREVVRESLQPALLSDYGNLLERLQETAARLRGLERYLSPASHDYQPNAGRLAMLLPNFAKGDGSEHALTVEAREVSRVEACLAAYAEELERDPMAKCPELPPLDTSADESTTYDQLTGPERAAVDREFVAVTRHRQTTDSELFAEQAREASPFRALTN
jgi:hypothetical protein